MEYENEIGINKAEKFSTCNSEKCRCCLAGDNEPSPGLVCIFAAKEPIITWLKECCAVSVSSDDGLPSTICNSCLEKLKSFYAFRTLCLNNETLLKERIDQFENVTEVKNEFIWEECLEEETFTFEDLGAIEQVKNEIFEEECLEFVSEEDENPNFLVEDGTIEELEPFQDDTKESVDAEIVLVVNKNDKICSVCQKNCITSTFLKEHIQYEHFGIKYYCSVCKKFYKSETRHNRRVHPTEPDSSKFYSQCHVCGERFRSTVHYGRHMRTKHQDRSVTCECGLTFKTIVKLNRHRSAAHCEPKFQCDHCSKMFTVKGKLKEHLKRHEDAKSGSKNFTSRLGILSVKVESAPVIKDKTTICPFCDRHMLCARQLRDHINYHHLGIKYFCELCNKHFASESIHNRRKHKDIHTALYSKSCYICHERFFAKHLIGRHMREKHGAKRGQCECGFKYRTPAALLKHRQLVHEKTIFMCPVCSKTCKLQKHLDVHMAVHSDSVYPCSYCPVKLKSRRSVVLHERRHNAKRDIPCPHCPLMFRTNTDLKQHVTSHDPSVKPHACAVCHVKRYRRTDYRNKHERRVHGYDRIREHRNPGKKIHVKYIPSGTEDCQDRRL